MEQKAVKAVKKAAGNSSLIVLSRGGSLWAALLINNGGKMKVRVKTLKEIFGTNELPAETPSPSFMPLMVQYCGREIEIKEKFKSYPYGAGWCWNVEWLEFKSDKVKQNYLKSWAIKKLKDQEDFINSHDPTGICDGAVHDYTYANFVLGNYYVPEE